MHETPRMFTTEPAKDRDLECGCHIVILNPEDVAEGCGLQVAMTLRLKAQDQQWYHFSK